MHEFHVSILLPQIYNFGVIDKIIYILVFNKVTMIFVADQLKRDKINFVFPVHVIYVNSVINKSAVAIKTNAI